MLTPEEIVYELGRDALADQESLVGGIRQRTGTLLAAHAMVASFLGSATLRAQGASPLACVAMAILVVGLALAVILLAPWSLHFTLDVRAVYDAVDGWAASGSAEWLANVGFAHRALQLANDRAVRRMSCLSSALAAVTILQAVAWMAALLIH